MKVKTSMNIRINNILRQARWFALLACGFIAFSAKAAEQEITLVQLEAGASYNAALLIGHWRKNVTGYTGPYDEHLVLYRDGTAQTWTTGFYSGARPKVGRWGIEANELIINWGDKPLSYSFTFHQGQLVMPNKPGARQFWDRIRDR